MGLARCYSLMKCLLILFSIIFLCAGIGVCAFAGWALWDGSGTESPSGRAGLCALAVWAAVLTLGAAAALAGAVRGSGSLLAAAFALLALAGAAEGGAAWWGAAHAGELRAALTERLRLSLRVEYGVRPSRTRALDAIQQHLRCCGADGPRDWQHAAWARAADLDLSVSAPPAYYYVPASCCAAEGAADCEEARRLPAASAGGAGLHAAPCAPRVLAALQSAARAPLAGAAALAAAHAAALLLALALALRTRPDAHYKA